MCNNYKNIRLKLLKINTAVWFNKICELCELGSLVPQSTFCGLDAAVSNSSRGKNFFSSLNCPDTSGAQPPV